MMKGDGQIAEKKCVLAVLKTERPRQPARERSGEDNPGFADLTLKRFREEREDSDE